MTADGPSPNPLPRGEGFSSVLLSGGRLHLQQGPIDLVCLGWGEVGAVRRSYLAACEAFSGVLAGLCGELGLLRQALPGAAPVGVVARAMHAACMPYAGGFITPMAAVAGAVADHVLGVMVGAAQLERAFVNNGGDIAFHLAPGQALRCGLVTDVVAPGLDGAFVLRAEAPSRGIATSGRACKGRGGKSFSLGIADAVTVLARTAAAADAAATVIGNAVDLPGHKSVVRRAAEDIDPESDLGGRLVTWNLGALRGEEVAIALDAGRVVADGLVRDGLIDGAVLALRGEFRVCLQQAVARAA